MTVLIARYTVKQDSVAELQAEAAKMFAAIDQSQPRGVRYVLGMLPDGVTVVGVVELEDGLDNPLPGIPAARAFQMNLQRWVAQESPTPRPLTVLGSYRLLNGG
jgi:hypothetical protein